VYLQESLLLNPSDVAGTTTVSAFVGMASKGPVNTPYLIESWSDYYTVFGGFDIIPPPPTYVAPPVTDVSNATIAGATDYPFDDLAALAADDEVGDGNYTGEPFQPNQHVLLDDASKAYYDPGTSTWKNGTFPVPTITVPTSNALSYLPFAIYSFFQNGGRFAWVVRSVGDDAGDRSEVDVKDTATTPKTSFTLTALSAGEWGNDIGFRLTLNQSNPKTFSLETFQKMADASWASLERFNNLSVKGQIAGTRRVDSVINDPVGGSKVVRLVDLDLAAEDVAEIDDITALEDGTDPIWPSAANLKSSCQYLSQIEGPMLVNIVGYLDDERFTQNPGDQEGEATSHFVSSTFIPSSFSDREDVISINDNADAKVPGSSSYAGTLRSDLSGDTSSYTAAYAPWILIPHPTQIGAVLPIPPAGAVMGMIARIDTTIGVHRAPAGIIATLSNAVGVQAKFTDSELGDLNQSNVNVIRSMIGSGICVMGARTRKGYGPDHYLSARRTLINLKESMRRSTQYAVFENNDERLWSSLRITAENILRPMWEQGGLRGSSPSQAYYVRCDASLNTINVIASGEVRMEIGVALEYPAEFVIIRITQITSSTFNNEVQSV
jgi:hypothetical protein